MSPTPYHWGQHQNLHAGSLDECIEPECQPAAMVCTCGRFQVDAIVDGTMTPAEVVDAMCDAIDQHRASGECPNHDPERGRR